MNKNLLELTIQGIKKKKKEYLLLYAVLTFSFTFILLILSITASMNKTNEEYLYDTYGIWDTAIFDGRSPDLEFLDKMGIGETGIFSCYGTVGANKGIGVINDSFVKLGRIQTIEGKLPDKPGEIAVEADLLSALGYDYELGQQISLQISFPDRDDPDQAGTSAEMTFVLSGVLKEYTDLWVTDGNVLNGAVITSEDGKYLSKEYGIVPMEGYIFQIPDKRFDKIRVIESYLKNSSGRKLYRNSNIRKQSAGKKMYVFYAGLVLCTTWLAVACIYLVQTRDKIRQITLFRCIGITKRQLKQMLLYETICLSLPAILSGSICGIVGTGAILKIYTQTGFETLRFSVSPLELSGAVFLWVAGIGGACFLVLQRALKQPITGTIYGSNEKDTRMRKWQSILAVLLGAMLNGVFFISVIQGREALHGKITGEKEESYYVQNLAYTDTKLTRKDLKDFFRIPGISHVKLYGRTWAALSFPHMESCQLAEDLLDDTDGIMQDLGSIVTGTGEEKRISFPEGLGVRINIIPEESFSDFFPEEAEINREKFLSGEQIIVAFPTDREGKIVFNGQETYKETGIKKGDEITLGFYGFPAKKDHLLTEPEKVGNFTVHVGEVYAVGPEWDEEKWVFACVRPYEIFCSEKLFTQMLEQMPQGYIVGNYLTGEPFAFTDADIYTTMNAEYLSTDAIIAEACSNKGIRLNNQREVVAAGVQQSLQRLVFIAASGICVIVILFLILWDILELSARKKRRSRSILRVLGISKRQLRIHIFGEALKKGILSVMGGLGIFGVYIWISCINAQRYFIEEYGINKEIYQVLGEEIESMRLWGVNGKMLAVTAVISVVGTICLYYFPGRPCKQEDILNNLREE